MWEELSDCVGKGVEVVLNGGARVEKGMDIRRLMLRLRGRS